MNISERNRIIDGWRGISVLFVVIGHYVSYKIGYTPPPINQNWGNPFDLLCNILIRVLSPLGGIGVDFFFIISGYLITSLLISEEIKNNRVSIKAFYIRRIFRILPAFYIYLISILLLYEFGIIYIDYLAFFRSGLYVCNFSGFGCSWWLAHTWSLSVEEQFYLCWPLLFVWLGSRRKAGIAAIAIILVVGSWWSDLLAPFAHISMGALVAVSDKVKDAIARISTAPVIIFSAIVVAIYPLSFPITEISFFILKVKPILISLIFFGTLLNGRGNLFIGNTVLVKIGLVSYSLYLWQQLSLAPMEWGGNATGAAILYENFHALVSLVFIPLAVASYHFVERPFIRQGHKLSNKILAGRS